MRKIIPFILAFFASVISVYGQPFQGKITYQNTYKSKIPNLTDQQFSSMLGTTQEYYIKEGNYKSVTNGTFSQWQLYTNATNKLFNKMSNSETIFWHDASVNDDSVITVETKERVLDVLGYKCDEIILTCKSGTQTFYFSTKLGVEAKLYVNHKYGNWYDYLKHTNAVPLKIVVDSKTFSIVSVATEVLAMKLDDKEFQLPENAKTERSAN